MDWKKRQAECKKCHGFGYTVSEAKHEDGRGPNAWAARCECQPRTLLELEEAAAQDPVPSLACSACGLTMAESRDLALLRKGLKLVPSND